MPLGENIQIGAAYCAELSSGGELGDIFGLPAVHPCRTAFDGHATQPVGDVDAIVDPLATIEAREIVGVDDEQDAGDALAGPRLDVEIEDPLRRDPAARVAIGKR